MKTANSLKIAGLCALSALLAACGSGTQFMPGVNGKAGEVIVVMDKVDWEGACGATLRSVLQDECKFLPQPEPLFTLINIPEAAFSSIFQSHRNILIFAKASDLPKTQMTVQHDVWAAPQLVITFSGRNSDSLALCLKENIQTAATHLEQAERDRVVQNARKYEELGVRRQVNAVFGGSVYFPKGYTVRKTTENFMWIEYGTTYTTQGFLVYTYPYSGPEDLTAERLVAIRNEVLQKEVPGPTQGSYMTTNTTLMPQMTWLQYKGRQFMELRGLWDVKNDFMAGPFVSHVFLDRENAHLMFWDAFVYAPKFEKRQYLRQVESILYSFEWEDAQPK